MDDTVTLSAEHYHELQWGSCITPSIITERGYQTLTGTGADRDLLESLGYKPYVWNRDDAYPGLLIPMRGMNGEVRGHQYKPAVPRTRIKADGTHGLIKYESPSGVPNVVDVPLVTAELLRESPGRSLWITEGVKKTDSLVSQGQAAIGLTGVFNWKSKEGVLGDWEEIPLKGRPAVVCFDADAAGNRNVQLAMGRLGAWLRARGVSAVHYIVVPATVGETDVKGVDDFFAAGGTLETLTAVATTTPPGAGAKDASFTDAFLVEELAEALSGRYCWASGLGWLRWNGRIWKDVSDVEPLEAVRVWASGEFDRTLAAQSENKAADMASRIAGWRAILNKGRLVALRDLAKGLLQRDSAEFDGDPDLLTVGNGTVHLPTAKLLPFDPEHCITKMCDAEYHPNASHASWTAALKAVPGDMHPWFQDRLGQALTGYMTPDHMMVIAHGGGSNGKSTVMEIVRKTLADYGVLVSDRVLMASPDAHPTELMDFRGARYALMEETPEARQLNTHRLKQTVGTPTIKARRIRMDPVEFIASHSLFINTNYRPTVTETDHGTWRRLSLMPWPFTFRKPGQPLTGPYDREGDPALAYAAGKPAVRDAALAWMVEGAQAWYARGRMMLPVPERVERETRDWRAETDLILGFSDECLRFEREAFTQTQDMLKSFNDWAGERGHRPWNDRTFASRFGAHDMVRGAKVQQGRFSVKGKQMRGWSGVEINKDGTDPFSGMRDEPQTDPDTGMMEPPAHDAVDRFGNSLWPDELEPPATTDEGPLFAPGAEEYYREVLGLGPKEESPTQPSPDAESQVNGPVALAFDLETADADKLFTGGHEGPFVRLVGAISSADEDAYPDVSSDPQALVNDLDRADVIYGHNILGFDLLALAHHHGADYDALAAKAVDTMVLARLVIPPLSKGMPNGYYGLDQVAQRLGHEGKTDDLRDLAKHHGGYDRIPLDSRDYQDYLRGDLVATKAVYESLRMLRMGDEGPSPSNAQIAYAEREMKIVALQNRMTLNGWAVDTELLTERVAREDAQRAQAVRILAAEYGMPTHRPERFKLHKRADWPERYWSWAVSDARANMLDDPEKAVRDGYAERIPGEAYDAPWATAGGREAIERAFRDAGAQHLPETKSGGLALSSDALGDKPWFNTDTGKSQPGLMQVYAGNEALGRVVELVLQATGARRKYAEVAKWVTDKGRVHAWIGSAQGSGRWAHVKPGISTMGKRGAGAAERDIMVADQGHVIITCDLSQVDLRAMAGLSQDPAYIEILGFWPDGTRRDAHMEMAQVYFGVQNAETRQQTKAFNHAGNYGQGPKAVSERTGIPLAKCYEIRDAKAEAYPRLAEYIEEVREEAASGRLLDNGFGRMMRPDPERAYTQGPALMGQGAARDIMCESLLRLVKYAEDKDQNVRPYLRAIVHDEVVLSVPENEAELWAQILNAAFTWQWRGVPILCDVSKPAFRWSECK
jgi:P4 family phage/plasmid primase-like protien